MEHIIWDKKGTHDESRAKSRSRAELGRLACFFFPLLIYRCLTTCGYFFFVSLLHSGADAYLAGEAAYETIMGIQSQGVQACAKHYVANEQEHNRTMESSNLDDKTVSSFSFLSHSPYRQVC